VLQVVALARADDPRIGVESGKLHRRSKRRARPRRRRTRAS
jgi:hypothetical protein